MSSAGDPGRRAERYCSSCIKPKHNDGFPTLGYPNVCWTCFWEQHQAEAHPLPRSEQRKLRKLARRIVEQRLTKEARDVHDMFKQLKEPVS